jgi:ribose transport system substrate-binding protein
MVDTLNERQISILKWIAGKKEIKAKQICEHFSLSRETVRKDLVILEQMELLERKAGAVSYLENPQNTKKLLSLGGLNKQQRRQQILQLLAQQKEMRISSLTNKLRVSSITIRNDLHELALEGKVLKKHGSVTLFEPTFSESAQETQTEVPAKTRMLGTHAMVHVALGDTIFLGHGSVSEYLASSVPPFSQVSIVTNSLQILETLKDRAYGYPVITTGTNVSLATQRFLLNAGEGLSQNTKIDTAFILCKSYHNQVYYLDEHEDIRTIEAVCKKAQRIYMFLDAKYIGIQGTCAFDHQPFLPKIHGILVDDSINHFRASITFPKTDPIIICGQDRTYRIVSKQRYRIGFLVNKDRNSFVQAVHNSILEATAACDSLSLVIHECEREYGSVVENLNKLAEEKVDLIIDYSLCLEALLYVGERCLQKDIRLISVDYLSSGALYFGADNAKAGQMAGQHAVSFIKKHWETRLDHIIILGKFGYEPITRMRISSALDEMESALPMQHVQMHQIEWGNPGLDPIHDLITLLEAIPQEEKIIIMAFNLPPLLATYEHVQRYRDVSNTIIIGQNHTKQVEAMMQNEQSMILGCVHYNPETYGESIIDLALNALNKNIVPARSYTNLSWIERPRST